MSSANMLTAIWLPKPASIVWSASLRSMRTNAGTHHFASVAVYPEIDDTIDVVIDEKDLRIDTYRSAGKGGQHVNTTDSAVRITHIPTNIVVQCQNERSQHKNKEVCMKVLRARLFELGAREKESGIAGHRGHQARYRVGQPDPLVRAAALPDGKGSSHEGRSR